MTSLLWWMKKEEALAEPQRLLQQVMAIGVAEHVAEARNRWSENDFRRALEGAVAGMFDKRSWSYWHTVLGVFPIPEMPVREFGDHFKE